METKIKIVVAIIILIVLIGGYYYITYNKYATLGAPNNPPTIVEYKYNFYQGKDVGGYDLVNVQLINDLDAAKAYLDNNPIGAKSFSVFNDGSINFKSVGINDVHKLTPCNHNLCVQPHAGWWVKTN